MTTPSNYSSLGPPPIAPDPQETELYAAMEAASRAQAAEPSNDGSAFRAALRAVEDYQERKGIK